MNQLKRQRCTTVNQMTVESNMWSNHSVQLAVTSQSFVTYSSQLSAAGVITLIRIYFLLDWHWRCCTWLSWDSTTLRPVAIKSLPGEWFSQTYTHLLAQSRQRDFIFSNYTQQRWKFTSLDRVRCGAGFDGINSGNHAWRRCYLWSPGHGHLPTPSA